MKIIKSNYSRCLFKFRILLNGLKMFLRYKIDNEQSLVIAEKNLQLVKSNNTMQAFRNIYYKLGIINWALFRWGYYDINCYQFVTDLAKVSV